MHHAPRFLAFADLPYRFTRVTCKLSVPRMLARSFSLMSAMNSARVHRLSDFSLVTLHSFEREFICIAIITENLFFYY